MQVWAVSPHFDDAALCAGGLLHGARAAGHSVTVVTAFTDDGHPAAWSAAAAEFHEECGVTGRLIGIRRAEDRAACARLGVERRELGLVEAVYRTTGDGTARHGTEASLYTAASDPVAPSDIVEDVARRLRDAVSPPPTPPGPAGAVVLLPLAVGRHVDHVAVRAAAEGEVEAVRGVAVYYEEWVYAWLGRHPSWRADCTAGLRPVRVELPPAAHAAKVAAIDAYATQVPMLFGRRSCRDVVPGAERFWVRDGAVADRVASLTVPDGP